MADQLKNILHFVAIPAGNTVSLPHGLHVAGLALIPDYIDPNPKGLTITADNINVTVTNTTATPLNVDVLCEAWHSIERAFGAVSIRHLTPQPFVSGTDVDPAAGGSHMAMFFGTTTGTGSAGNDYAATIAVQTTAGTGRVPFPRNGNFVGSHIARNSASDFIVDLTGIYEVGWMVGIVEASQLQLAVNDVGIANTCNLSGAGTQINSNRVLVSLVAGDKISIINPPGNSTALTVQPADGSDTHAQAPNILIRLVA
jgi:hypothetical protein